MERDKLLGTMDAKVWTDEFMATKARLGDEEFDHTMMLAWFANAIMAGFDEANRCAQRALDAAQELSAAWAEKARQYELELEGDPQNLHGKGRTFGLRSQLATLQADNECKDSLIETLQAQLQQVEGERDAHAQDVDDLIDCCINDVLVTHATPGGKPHDPDPQIRPLRDKIAGSLVELQTLRQLVEALPVLDMRFDSVAVGPLGWTVGGVTFGKVTEANAYSALLQYRATQAAQDAGKEGTNGL